MYPDLIKGADHGLVPRAAALRPIGAHMGWSPLGSWSRFFLHQVLLRIGQLLSRVVGTYLRPAFDTRQQTRFANVETWAHKSGNGCFVLLSYSQGKWLPNLRLDSYMRESETCLSTAAQAAFQSACEGGVGPASLGAQG